MQVWVDAQLSPAIAQWLRQECQADAIAVRDLGLRNAEDPQIFAKARAAAAVVLTKDRDFVDLVTRHGPPPQIVWLTCGNTSNTFLRGILVNAWPRVLDMLAAGEPLIEIAGRGNPQS